MAFWCAGVSFLVIGCSPADSGFMERTMQASLAALLSVLLTAILATSERKAQEARMEAREREARKAQEARELEARKAQEARELEAKERELITVCHYYCRQGVRQEGQAAGMTISGPLAACSSVYFPGKTACAGCAQVVAYQTDNTVTSAQMIKRRTLRTVWSVSHPCPPHYPMTSSQHCLQIGL